MSQLNETLSAYVELKLYIPADVIEYFVRRRFDEQAKGCLCYECELTRALCLSVLAANERELRILEGITLQ